MKLKLLLFPFYSYEKLLYLQVLMFDSENDGVLLNHMLYYYSLILFIYAFFVFFLTKKGPEEDTI